jgi:hypothetical protein
MSHTMEQVEKESGEQGERGMRRAVSVLHATTPVSTSTEVRTSFWVAWPLQVVGALRDAAQPRAARCSMVQPRA